MSEKKVVRQKRDPFPIILNTAAGVCRILGIEYSTLWKWAVKPDFPGGDKGPWRLDAVIAWLRAGNRAGLGDQQAPQGEQDLLREEKAKIARLNRMKLEGSVVPRESNMVLLESLASSLRRLGEQLERQHGAAARELLDECMDELERHVLANDREIESEINAEHGEHST